MTDPIRLNLNGTEVELASHPLTPLLHALRNEGHSPGTKYGCGEGECGACTVLLNGEAVMSCMVPICQVEGATVETIEGLCVDGNLHPLQEAFICEGGAQCGICTPGMLMSALYFLRQPEKAPGGIREVVEGNLCRCTGYTRIYKSIERAVREVAKP